MAAGHRDGSIYIWNISKPSSPLLHIAPLLPDQLRTKKLAGHLAGIPITHLNFLDGLNTAIVSSDISGMAFTHMAHRSLTLMSLSCVSIRVLGRYFYDMPAGGKPRKPSTVLALAALPLGNVEQKSDNMGVVALITPYLLVIISSIPVARTQHKLSRPSAIQRHSMMSGCLAWFPAIRARPASQGDVGEVFNPKLAYSWSSALMILEMRSTERLAPSTSSLTAELAFRGRVKWEADEPIVAVQWFSRSILAILTVTQRLVILEEATLRATEALDLSQRHILHIDVFSKQLGSLVDGVDEQEDLHGVTADAFFQSFKTYKSRIYLLGFHDLWIGALANWADRLLAMMNAGDAIGAIRLAASYYVGSDDRLIVGLPDSDSARKSIVQDKLLGLMGASADYVFSRVSQTDVEEEAGRAMIFELANACVDASMVVDQLDYLFEDIFEAFEKYGQTQIFIECLEVHIMDGSVVSAPPPVMKQMVEHLLQEDREKLEKMLCHMKPEVLDLDTMTKICGRERLFDALIYLYSVGLEDWVTPLIQLMALIDRHNQALQERDASAESASAQLEADHETIMKLFPYLSYALTGRVYPTEASLSEAAAEIAKSQLLYFIFSGRPVAWPQPGGSVFHLGGGRWRHTTFAYLKAILLFDTPAFLTVLDEVFEDDFLNDSDDQEETVVDSNIEYLVFAASINRQYIVTILLEILQSQDFRTDSLIYLDMFLARNMPKYPQYLRLPEAVLGEILTRLCSPPSDDLIGDCQLSVEYLLSVYHPSSIDHLIPQLERARFWNVLKSLYRSQHDYTNLVRACLKDDYNPESVFEAVGDALSHPQARTPAELDAVEALVRENASQLLEIDLAKTSAMVNKYLLGLHSTFLQILESSPDRQYRYLKVWCEAPSSPLNPQSANSSQPAKQWLTLYLRLMCRFKPDHVKDFVQNLPLEDLQLDDLLDTMEENEVVDASVTLMARTGQLQKAMDRLVAYLEALSELLSSGSLEYEESDSASHDSRAVQPLLESVQKYVSIGIWVCQSAETLVSHHTTKSPPTSGNLTNQETLWLDLMTTSVRLTQRIPTSPSSQAIKSSLRTTIQSTFTAFLRASSSTSAPPPLSTSPPTSPARTPRFVPVFRAFLTLISSGTPLMADVRAVCADIFASYAFEEGLLAMVHRMQDKDLFLRVDGVQRGRERGWRPAGVACGVCGRSVWGAGVGEVVWRAWVQREGGRREREGLRRGGDGDAEVAGLEGKGKSRELQLQPERGGGQDGGLEAGAAEALVVFSCRHVFHTSCLDRLRGDDSEPRGRYICPLESS